MTSTAGYKIGKGPCHKPAGSSSGGEFTSCKGGTSIVSKDGKWSKDDGTALDSETTARLKALKVPPGWTHVRVNPNKDASLQVVGRDSKGRTQRLYSAEHSERAAAEKFSRLKEFQSHLPKIRKQINHDLTSPNPRVRETAQVLHLINLTGFRIGGSEDTGAEKDAFGASTLLSHHVTVNGTKVSFSFTGKKGVHITKTVNNEQLATFVLAKKNRVGANSRLFDVSDAQTRAYLKSITGRGFKVKDFRTYHGTSMALKHLKKYENTPPKTAAEAKKIKLAVAKAVSDHLGNTPTVAIASYIDPSVWGNLEKF